MRVRLADVGAAGALVLTAHTVVNAALLRRPAGTSDERISAVVPARDEEPVVGRCVRALLAAGADEVVVVDDSSSDATAEVAAAAGATVVAAGPLPAGWLGKPWACTVGARAATGTVLAFVDADVVVHALRPAAALLRARHLQLVSPYPRLLAVSPLERLVQPLLPWSWLTTLPLRLAERSTRPSLSAAGGQLLLVDAAAYAAAGGHPSSDVLDDLGLLKALKRKGFRGVVVDGTAAAEVRMYDGGRALVDGYAKSLHAAFGGPAGSVAVVGALLVLYVLPPLALLRRRSPLIVAGTAAGFAGRAVTAARTGGSVPDAALHPLSVLAFAALDAVSWQRRRTGTATWKGRRV